MNWAYESIDVQQALSITLACQTCNQDLVSIGVAASKQPGGLNLGCWTLSLSWKCCACIKLPSVNLFACYLLVSPIDPSTHLFHVFLCICMLSCMHVHTCMCLVLASRLASMYVAVYVLCLLMYPCVCARIWRYVCRWPAICSWWKYMQLHVCDAHDEAIKLTVCVHDALSFYVIVKFWM